MIQHSVWKTVLNSIVIFRSQTSQTHIKSVSFICSSLPHNSIPTGTYMNTHTHLLLHTHNHTHTRGQQLREEWQWLSSVIGSELQLQQKPWSCRKPVSVWHLLLSFSSAGRHNVKHLGWDIIPLPSAQLSHVTTVPATTSATTNNTSVSGEAIEMTRLFPSWKY